MSRLVLVAAAIFASLCSLPVGATPVFTYQGSPHISVADNRVCLVAKGTASCWDVDTYQQTQARQLSIPWGKIDAIALGESRECFLVDGKVQCTPESISPQPKMSPAFEGRVQGITSERNIYCAWTNFDYACFGARLPEAVIKRAAAKILRVTPNIVWTTRGIFDANGVRINVTGIEDAVELVANDQKEICMVTRTGELSCSMADRGTATLSVPQMTHPRFLAVAQEKFCATGDEGVSCWEYKHFREESTLLSLKIPDGISGVRGFYSGGETMCATTATGLQCWKWDGSDYRYLLPSFKVNFVKEEVSEVRAIVAGVAGDMICARTPGGLQCFDGLRRQQVVSGASDAYFVGSTACAVREGVFDCGANIHVVGVERLTSRGNNLCVEAASSARCWTMIDFGHGVSATEWQLPAEVATAKFLAVSTSFVCGLSEDTVKCATKDNRRQANLPHNLQGARAIAASKDGIYVALDHEIRCFAARWCQQFPADLETVSQLATDSYGSNICAITASGVRCWGGTLASQVPSDLGNVQELALTDEFACAVTTNGLRCWGSSFGNSTEFSEGQIKQVAVTQDNIYGHVSPGACVQSDLGIRCSGVPSRGTLAPPRDIPGVRDFFSDSRSGWSCAAGDEGLTCWSSEHTSNTASSTIKLGPPGALKVAGSDFGAGFLACGIWADTVRCFTVAATTETHDQALVVPPLKNPTRIGGSEFGAVCAIDDTGLVCWYYNNQGVVILSNGVQAHPTALAVSTGFACTVEAGRVACFSYPPTGPRVPPTPPESLVDAVEITAGYNHVCALRATGEVQCFGGNEYGQAAPPTGLRGILGISASKTLTCAHDGRKVTCWGLRESFGVAPQLGGGVQPWIDAPLQSRLGLNVSDFLTPALPHLYQEKKWFAEELLRLGVDSNEARSLLAFAALTPFVEQSPSPWLSQNLASQIPVATSALNRWSANFSLSSLPREQEELRMALEIFALSWRATRDLVSIQAQRETEELVAEVAEILVRPGFSRGDVLPLIQAARQATDLTRDLAGSARLTSFAVMNDELMNWMETAP